MSEHGEILVVDDSPEARFARRRALTRAGFRVREAATGAECLAALRETPADLVVLDVNLPDGSGFELCRTIKAEAADGFLPVVQVSHARIDPTDQVAGLEGGADAYLTEPIEPSVLIATARALLRERRAQARLRTLLSLSAAVAAAVRPEEIVEAAARATCGAVTSDSSAVGLRNGRALRVRFGVPDPAMDARYETIDMDAEADRASVLVVETGEPLLLRTRAELLARLPAMADDAGIARVEAMAVVPIRARSRTQGFISAFSYRPQAFDDSDLAVLHAIAEVCAQALERAELYVAEAAARAEAEAAARRNELRAALVELLELERGTRARAEQAARFCVTHLADAAVVEDAAGRTLAAAGDAPLLEVLRAGHAGAVLGFPLSARGEPIGRLLLAREALGFDGDDERLARELVFPIALTLDNARLDDEQRHIARTLQLSLLAGAVGALPDGVSVALRYRPGEADLEVGGDWHDAGTRHDGRVALVVGDVVGHGLRASTAMGTLRSSARSLVRLLPDAAAVLSELDDQAGGAGQTPMVTVACVLFDPRTGALEHASAGHPPPLLVAPDGSGRFLVGGRTVPIAGLAPEREVERATLAPGGLVVLCSDGLIERRGEALDDGLALLKQSVARHFDRPTLAETADAVLQDLLGDQAPRDDVALLLARRPARPDDAASWRMPAGSQPQLAAALARYLTRIAAPAAVADGAQALLSELWSALPEGTGEEIDLEVRWRDEQLHAALRLTGPDPALGVAAVRVDGVRVLPQPGGLLATFAVAG